MIAQQFEILRQRCVLTSAARLRRSFADRLHQILYLTHRKPLLEDALIYLQLHRRIIYGKQRARMPHIKTLVAQTELHFGRKPEKAQKVGYRSTFLADTLTQTFLRKIVALYQFLECQRYLYRINW